MKNPFWGKDDSDDEEIKTLKQSAKKVAEPAPTAPIKLQESLSPVFSVPNTKFRQFLMTKNAMPTTIVEATRYIAAFAGVSVNGITKADLLDSASQELEKINAETSAFMDEYNSVYDTKVVQRKRHLADLSKELARISDEISKLDAETKSDEADILAGKNRFMSEQTDKIGNMNDEMNKIKQYIQ